MIFIEFAHFCNGIYDFTEGVSNKGAFVISLFRAAGSNFCFSEEKGFSQSNYAAKLCSSKGRPLSKKQRSSFPNPINTAGLAKYLSEHIKKASIRNVMNNFTIPTDADENIIALTRALADQLQIIIHEPDSDEDVVSTNYQQYLSEPEEAVPTFHKPLYDGDKFWVETAPAERQHTVDFYEHFTHVWSLHNTGKVKWVGRKLVCKNETAITPCATQQSVDIPDTAPDRRVNISVEFDARGKEDRFISEWIMVDRNGKDCYPNYSSPFNVAIVVENKRFTRSGGSEIG